MRRAFDIAVSALALLIASPILLGAIVWIVIESPGSPFFHQRRVGKDGQDFMLFKLRTMVKNAESKGAGLAVDENDESFFVRLSSPSGAARSIHCASVIEPSRQSGFMKAFGKAARRGMAGKEEVRIKS